MHELIEAIGYLAFGVGVVWVVLQLAGVVDRRHAAREAARWQQWQDKCDRLRGH
jgi:hypothetical protein